MKNIIEISSLYYQVFEYIEGRKTLSALEQWLVTNLDSLLLLASPDARELINTIELGRAEMSEKHRTEKEFQQELRQFFSTHPTLNAGFEPVNATTSSNATTQSTDQAVSEPAPRFSYTRL